jgi:hypothetical protein
MRIKHWIERVYDYADAQVPMLARMFEKRLKSYVAIGYELESKPAWRPQLSTTFE